ncbi:MAG: prepilin-type N-terminal cleavage/methylation domain-containing protein [Hyphomicrobium sp.]|nr:prepilin-type N-terminal cleavage/methylation domain-containing protein [Hyphomicrobium sp.]
MNSADGGFTLIEALVALVLIATAAAAFYSGLDTGTRGARFVERELAALSIANSRLAEAIALGPVSELPRSGQSGDGMTWSTTFDRYALSKSDSTAPPPHVMLIKVRVSWRDTPGRPLRELTLTTLKSEDGP